MLATSSAYDGCLQAKAQNATVLNYANTLNPYVPGKGDWWDWLSNPGQPSSFAMTSSVNTSIQTSKGYAPSLC